MNRILCVIDFSHSAAKVLEVASRITKAYEAQLVILFPYRLIEKGYPGDIASLRRKLERQALEKFDMLKKDIPFMNDLRFEFHAEIGFIPDRINAHLRRSNIDMVVIAQTQNISPLEGKVYNIQELISESQIPFVIVPSPIAAETIMSSLAGHSAK